MTSAAINELTQRYCKKEIGGFVQLMHTALTVYVTLAGLLTALGFAVFARLPLDKIGVHDNSHEVGTAAALLVAQVVWYFPSSVVFNFYRTIGDFHKSQWLGNLYQFLLIVVTATGLVTGAGFVRIAALQLGVLLVLTILVALFVNLRYQSVAIGFTNTSLSEIGPLLRSGSSFAVMTIGNAISMQGPILVISSSLGPLFVAAFSTARTLANSVRQLVGVFSFAAWPELTVAQAAGDQEIARRLHRTLVTSAAVVSVAAGALLWFVGPQIIGAWTHAHLPYSGSLIRLFAIQVVLQAPWIASSCVSESSNKNRLLSKLYLGSAVTSVVLSALTITHFGILAVPISIIIAEICICSHFVIKDSCTLVAENYRTFAFQLWTRLLVLIVVATLVAKIATSLAPQSVIPRAFAVFASAGVAVFATAWFGWLKGREKDRITSIIRGFTERVTAKAAS
jgi:O-antigen/teichoic acid export membrane protein